MKINDELEKLAGDHMISYFGVSDLSGTGVGEYPYCVTLGIVLPDEVVDRLPFREQYVNALNYKIFAYDIINHRLDLAVSVLGGFIQSRGYRAIPVPASGIIDNDRICGSFSHKIGARLCGFGWIGKSCLLITPKDGPRVRWASILTDAPLQPSGKAEEEQGCGKCTACADICPVNAIAGRGFDENEPREMRLDARRCWDYLESIKETNKNNVCGMCLYVCPHGRKREKKLRDSARF